ncbi:MAG: hypothetical protein UV05_C0051G0006 [candidate division CPR1 bacterium GW2011_GWA2_42_17]|uniref:Uncharacterized protein n=1 Tax=candidate division CPR1 bacterium GW2011_GWA2_42_17 TaxID=1618341 RepID=A0A0G0YZ76_9BACT|nr:MAG: hypothetical protein UV05_C0051G0006 [candidate division CPR1 bacterium GW2011_GWA2_42_17]
MNTKKILLSTSALALAGVIGFGAINLALADQGDSAQIGLNCTAERHEAMEKAFESNDYNAWKDLMQGRGRVSQIITQDNFAKFAEIHKLVEQGKYAEADAIRQELGLGMGQGQKSGMGFGQGMGHGRMAR